MKYIVNENNSCGAASLSDELRNRVLESLGFESNKAEVPEQITESVSPQAEADDSYDMPTLYEWDGNVFALDDEVFEIEGELFLKAVELDSETRMGLDESHADLFINEVKFEEDAFSLGDIYDFGTETFISLSLSEGEAVGGGKPVDHSEADAYAKSIAKKYAPGSDGNAEHHADVKAKYPDYVQRSLRDKPDGQVKKEEQETSQARVKRQIGNLDPNSAKGRERTSGLKQLAKARELDKSSPVTKPKAASDSAANASAAAHGDK